MSYPKIITWLPVDTELIADDQTLDYNGISTAMVLGVVVIPTTKVQNTNDIQLTLHTFGTAHGQWHVSAVDPGVSFTVTSTDLTETSTVSWGIMPTSWAKGTSNALGPGSVFVAEPTVTQSSNILLTYATNPGGNGGVLSAPTASIQPGVGFVIISSNHADTAHVNWVITNLVPNVVVPLGGTQGTNTLVAGTVTVDTTSVSANSIILLSDNTLNAPTSYVSVTAINPGVSFTITAEANTDLSSINWAILSGGHLILNSKVFGQPKGNFIYDKVIRQVQLNSTGDESAVEFTITGIGSPTVDGNGNGNPTQVVSLITENIQGPNADFVNSVNIYQQIISITANGPVGNISAGSGPAGITDFVFLDTNSSIGLARCSLQFVNHATMEATAYTSLNKPQIIDQNAGNLINSPFLPDDFIAFGHENVIAVIPTPSSVVWLTIETTTNDSLNFTVLQQGVYP